MIKASLRVLLSAAATVALLASTAAAQDKPNSNAGKKEQPPAAAPQKSADKDPKNPTQTAEKPTADRSQDKSKDKPNDKPNDKSADRNANRDTQRSTDRSQDKSKDKPNDKPNDKSADKNANRDTQRPTDRSRDTERATDRSRDTSRDSQRSTDRSRDTGRDSSRDTSRDTQRSTDRSRDTSRETSRDSQRSSDQSKQNSKQVTASDLGFTFSDDSSDDGLKITNISSNTLATKAKFKESDVIVSVNDNRIRSQRDFIHFLQVAPRQRITVIVLRDDREVPIYLEPAIIQEFLVVESGGWLGVDLVERYTRAAVIGKVHPNSPAERAGLKSDDLIISVDGIEIRSPHHLGEVVGGMSPGANVEIEVERNRREFVTDATLGRKENVAQRTEVRR